MPSTSSLYISFNRWSQKTFYQQKKTVQWKWASFFESKENSVETGTKSFRNSLQLEDHCRINTLQ